MLGYNISDTILTRFSVLGWANIILLWFFPLQALCCDVPVLSVRYFPTIMYSIHKHCGICCYGFVEHEGYRRFRGALQRWSCFSGSLVSSPLPSICVLRRPGSRGARVNNVTSAVTCGCLPWRVYPELKVPACVCCPTTACHWSTYLSGNRTALLQLWREVKLNRLGCWRKGPQEDQSFLRCRRLHFCWVCGRGRVFPVS